MTKEREIIVDYSDRYQSSLPLEVFATIRRTPVLFLLALSQTHESDTSHAIAGKTPERNDSPIPLPEDLTSKACEPF